MSLLFKFSIYLVDNEFTLYLSDGKITPCRRNSNPTKAGYDCKLNLPFFYLQNIQMDKVSSLINETASIDQIETNVKSCTRCAVSVDDSHPSIVIEN